MKASDYVLQFRAQGSTPEACASVITTMLDEVKQIGEQRKVQYDHSFASILDEMNLKFQSFIRQTGEKFSDGSLINPKGFVLIVQKLLPEVFEGWNRQRGGKLLLR